MRLGEVLLTAGMVTQQQLDEVLRAQVVRGGRLGTNLVEHRLLTLDELSTALGIQHGLPAALGKHFEAADRELQRRLSPELARMFECIPLVRAGKRIVIASCAPLDDKANALVAGALDINRHYVVQSIAAEMRIHYQLERVYDIPRQPRLLRTRSTQPRPTQPAPAEDRRGYVKTLADELEHDSTDPVVGIETVIARVQVKREELARPLAIGSSQLRRIELPVIADTLTDALAALAQPADRDELGGRLIGTIARFVPEARSSLLLCVREDAAVSWRSIGPNGTELPELAVPFDRPGLITAALRRKQTSRGASGDLGAMDYLLLAALGAPFGDLVVAPIVVDDVVAAIVVLATERHALVMNLLAIVNAASAGFAHLIGNATSSGERPRGEPPATRSRSRSRLTGR